MVWSPNLLGQGSWRRTTARQPSCLTVVNTAANCPDALLKMLLPQTRLEKASVAHWKYLKVSRLQILKRHLNSGLWFGSLLAQPTKTNTAANCLNVLSFFCFFPQTNPMLKIPHGMSLTTLKCVREQWSPVFAAFMPNCNKHGCRVYRHLIKNILKILKNVPIYRLMSQKTQKKTLYLQIWWTEGWGGLLLADETVLPLKQIKSLKSKTLE